MNFDCVVCMKTTLWLMVVLALRSDRVVYNLHFSLEMYNWMMSPTAIPILHTFKLDSLDHRSPPQKRNRDYFSFRYLFCRYWFTTNTVRWQKKLAMVRGFLNQGGCWVKKKIVEYPQCNVFTIIYVNSFKNSIEYKNSFYWNVLFSLSSKWTVINLRNSISTRFDFSYVR